MKCKYALFLTLLLPISAIAGSIQYEGSSTVGKFIKDASAVYSSSSFNIKTATESSGGEKCAARGSCDIGGVARGVNQKFLKKGVQATLIGKDAIAAIVNGGNPVSGLTGAQLKGIFTGKIKNWSEVGGTDQVIKPYIVKKGSATRKVFRNVVMQGADYAGAKVVTPDAKILSIVSRDAGAIGQISFAFLSDAKGIKPVDVDGQTADVSNSSYPITRPLHLTTKGAPTGDAKAFITWALSAEGQAVVKKRFVSVK